MSKLERDKELAHVFGELATISENKVVVYTYGAWDLLHPGHIIFLERAKKLGDILIVGVISDNAIGKLKGKDRPVQTQDDRHFIVKNLKCVDFALRQAEYDPSEIIKEINTVNILTKGDDWDYIPGQETIASLGGSLVKLSYSESHSTSSLISKISGRKVNKRKEY